MINNFATDPSIASFMSRAQLTGGTQFSAANYLVTALKQTTIWNKLIGMWPMVGGNATAHAQNIVSTAYTVTWNGAWVHSATGAKPSGASTCFGDTGLIPISACTQNSAALGYYSRTQNTALQQPIGATGPGSGAYNNRFEIAYNAGLFCIVNTTSTAASYVPATTLGLISSSRTGATAVTMVKNGVLQVSSTTNTSTGLATSSIYLGAENNGGAISLPSTWECALAYVANGLSVSEMITLDGIVQTYQTMLNRQV